jgi:hypothetical protein
MVAWGAVTVPLVAFGAVSFPTTPGLGALLVVTLANAAMFGLPIALVTCWVIDVPILWHIMARPVSWRSAAPWGVAIAAAMDLAFLLIAGVGQLADNRATRPAPSSWLNFAEGSMLALIGGLAVALVVRAVIGPGRPTQ